MAAYHELTTIQISSILVIELANDNYEIVADSYSVIVCGNDLTKYLNNLSPSVKVTYQFLEDFS
jgi:hypothetical protein